MKGVPNKERSCNMSHPGVGVWVFSRLAHLESQMTDKNLLQDEVVAQLVRENPLKYANRKFFLLVMSDNMTDRERLREKLPERLIGVDNEPKSDPWMEMTNFSRNIFFYSCDISLKTLIDGLKVKIVNENKNRMLNDSDRILFKDLAPTLNSRA